ncbi:MAG: phospho-sugar mutase [Myxococcales bacterium]|nr:phospho-sugar mutase [Myxococcales bacterium]
MITVRTRAARWLAEDPDPVTRAELQSLLDADDEAGLADRFRATLAFGTAGLRGVVGAGPNRMNRVMVLKASHGVGATLVESVPDAASRGVVVGYDGRLDSRRFAEDAARAFLGLGLKVYLFDALGPTPCTAFAVKTLGAAAGVMVTASHNPPEYNGYKVYWSDGAQIVPPVDALIAARIEALGSLAEVPSGALDEARRAGRLVGLGEALEAAYLAGVRALSRGAPARLSVAYTAMHGVGARLATRLLAEAGEVHSVAAQEAPDGRFPTVRFPNPEEPGAMDLALALAAEKSVDLVIANDPDADRLAVGLRGADGRYRMLNGNEIGALLGHDALVSDPGGDRKLVATTIVSSPLLGVIAAAEGAEYAETLTGFKWIIANADARCQATGARFVFGYEEALGYCVGTLVRDKDGLSAAAAMASLASRLKARGQTLEHRLEEIARRYGLFVSGQHNVTLPGAEGQRAIAAMMARLRAAPPGALDGRRVVGLVDYARGEGTLDGRPVATGLPPSDVLKFVLDDGSRVMARPSGTEPKIKFYFDQKERVGAGEAMAAARARAEAALGRMMRAFVAGLG